MTTPDAAPEQLLHELRNRLNSLLMNAAVLRARLPEGERDSPFAHRIDEDGRRCAELLRQIEQHLR